MLGIKSLLGQIVGLRRGRICRLHISEISLVISSSSLPRRFRDWVVADGETGDREGSSFNGVYCIAAPRAIAS